METKNKDQETQVTVHLRNKEDQKQSRAEKNGSGSSSHDNGHPTNQEFQLNFQRPCSSQANVEETPLISKVNIPSPSCSPVVPGQWPNTQVQNSHLPLHSTHACTQFWPAQRPWYSPPEASYHSLALPGITNGTWPGTGTSNGDFSLGDQQPLPCYSYPICCPYPGFPGTYGPLSWWGQPQLHQQPMAPFSDTNAGSDGHFVSSSFPSCFAAGALSNQRGFVQQPANLSEKHQRHWDAQSEENAQLWSVIGTLKSELAEYKTRLTKLEMNSFSPKPIVKESSGNISLRPTEKEPAGNLSLKPIEKEPSSDVSLKQTEKEPGGDTRAFLQESGKRKRGRPRKQSAYNDLISFLDTRVSLQGSRKRKRGRPRRPSVCNNLIPFLDQSSGKEPAMLNAQERGTLLDFERESKQLEDRTQTVGKTTNLIEDSVDRIKIRD
ncbi:hypothetical protein POM88_020891 [Heracleum sosnowskyi]|uniref:Uncharacterized protein n=1 Tax=Heracleum sosnowskyi TaxID=360622 RepID=A0AAD8IDT5_9APIA|nr:hypothetical protein POM88_020891 [Heracleum sosnowskyi]